MRTRLQQSVAFSAQQLNAFVTDRDLVYRHMLENDELVQTRLLDLEALPEITRRVHRFVHTRIPLPSLLSSSYQSDLVHGIIQKLLVHNPESKEQKALALYLHRTEGPTLAHYLCKGWPNLSPSSSSHRAIRTPDEFYLREIKCLVSTTTSCTDLVLLSGRHPFLHRKDDAGPSIDRIGHLFARDFLTGRRHTKMLALIQGRFLRGLWALLRPHTVAAPTTQTCCVLI